MTDDTRDDGSVEARQIADALDAAERMGRERDVPEGACYVQISDTLAREWSASLRRIQSGAYRSSLEAGRIAAEAARRIDERNDEVGRLTCSGDERLMYDALQRIAALTTDSTGSEPGEREDGRVPERKDADGAVRAGSHRRGRDRGPDRLGADRGHRRNPDLTPPSEDGERERIINEAAAKAVREVEASINRRTGRLDRLSLRDRANALDGGEE